MIKVKIADSPLGAKSTINEMTSYPRSGIKIFPMLLHLKVDHPNIMLRKDKYPPLPYLPQGGKKGVGRVTKGMDIGTFDFMNLSI